MPLKIPAQSVKVFRKGPVYPTIGVPFDFTDDEIAHITEVSPDALLTVNVKEARDIVAAVDGDDSKGKPAPRGKKTTKTEDDDDL